MTQIHQHTQIVLSAADVVSLELSVPYWEDLASEPANRGFVRHGGVPHAVDNVGPTLKRPYSEHVQRFLVQRGDGQGVTPRTLLAWGTRNTFQNLGLPGWDKRRSPSLLCRADEPWHAWMYAGVGSFRGTPRFVQARFEVDAAENVTPEFEDNVAAADCDWFITGQPILWDGVLAPAGSLAALTYDLRHVWRLRWEDWQNCPRETAIHEELMEIFLRNLDRSVEERANALGEIARRYELMETAGYLHSSLGITPAGDLTLLTKTGSLREIAAAQKGLGAERAILLDNGGSVGLAYWSQYAWKRLGWTAIAEQPTFFGNGTYFRPRGHAVLIAELARDLPDGPSAE